MVLVLKSYLILGIGGMSTLSVISEESIKIHYLPSGWDTMQFAMVFVINWWLRSKKDWKILVRGSQALLTIGETPCLLSEIGIPYDMDNKKAYRDGNYTEQYTAMDANHYALERAGLSYTLWNYCPDVSSFEGLTDIRTIMNGVTFGIAKISACGVTQMFALTIFQRRVIQI